MTLWVKLAMIHMKKWAYREGFAIVLNLRIRHPAGRG